jgi:hypothetical protein
VDDLGRERLGIDTPQDMLPLVQITPEYSITPPIRINWEGEPCGYTENPDNWIFL